MKLKVRKFLGLYSYVCRNYRGKTVKGPFLSPSPYTVVTPNFVMAGDKIQNALWHINKMSFPLSLQYIIIYCGTNNIGHNNPQVILDGLINLAWVIKKKYKDRKLIINSVLPRNDSSSQKIALVIAPAAWQNPVTRFLAILNYHHFLGYLGLENGKWKNTVTFHQKPFFKSSEWQNLVTSCFHWSYITGKT